MKNFYRNNTCLLSMVVVVLTSFLFICKMGLGGGGVRRYKLRRWNSMLIDRRPKPQHSFINRKMSLGKNRIESLPDSISKLTTLQILSAPQNCVQSLPRDICGCKSLYQINLSHNNVEQLPYHVGACPALIDLELDGNPLRGVESVMSSKQRLRFYRENYNRAVMAKIALERDSPNLMKLFPLILERAFED